MTSLHKNRLLYLAQNFRKLEEAPANYIIKDGKFSINGVVNETYRQLTDNGKWGDWTFQLNNRKWTEYIAPEAAEFFAVDRPEFLVINGQDMSALEFHTIAERLEKL